MYMYIAIELIQRPRKFHGIDFEEGSPNLIVTRSGKTIHELTITIYYLLSGIMLIPTLYVIKNKL